MADKAVDAVAERYAAALFELAEERGALDAVADDLRSLRAMIAESLDLRRLLTSPVIDRADQERALTALAKAAGLSEIVANLLGLLARNRRSMMLPGVIQGYLATLAARRGEVVASVVSAQALSEAQAVALAAALKAAGGGNVTLEASVDPALLGGMVVKLGSRQVDGSLRTKLQRMRLAMKGVA